MDFTFFYVLWYVIGHRWDIEISGSLFVETCYYMLSPKITEIFTVIYNHICLRSSVSSNSMALYKCCIIVIILYNYRVVLNTPECSVIDSYDCCYSF